MQRNLMSSIELFINGINLFLLFIFEIQTEFNFLLLQEEQVLVLVGLIPACATLSP
jgi:hypothetical protein